MLALVKKLRQGNHEFSDIPRHTEKPCLGNQREKNGVLTVETLNPGIQIVLGTSDTQTMWLLSCLYVVTFFQLEADFLNIEVDRGNFIFTGH